MTEHRFRRNRRAQVTLIAHSFILFGAIKSQKADKHADMNIDNIGHKAGISVIFSVHLNNKFCFIP